MKKSLYSYHPLHIAVKDNNIESVKQLLAQGADVNVRDVYRNTPLHLATVDLHNQQPNADIVKILLEHGANVNAKNILGNTPICLIKSSKTHALQILKLLIEHGADVDIDNYSRKSIRKFIKIQIDDDTYCSETRELLNDIWQSINKNDQYQKFNNITGQKRKYSSYNDEVRDNDEEENSENFEQQEVKRAKLEEAQNSNVDNSSMIEDNLKEQEATYTLPDEHDISLAGNTF